METKPTRKAASKWHAVSVVLCTSSCAAAALCRNARYLAGEAPRFPLNGCEHPEDCKCKYRHFEDRRNGARRESEIGMHSGSAKPDSERRAGRGRRARDKV